MIRRLSVLFLLALPALAGGASPASDDIDRDRAIEIARAHLKFEPESTVVEAGEDAGRPVWRIRFKGPAGPRPTGRYLEVVIDRKSGEVVALAQD